MFGIDPFIIVGVVFLALVVWAIFTFNAFVRERNLICRGAIYRARGFGRNELRPYTALGRQRVGKPALAQTPRQAAEWQRLLAAQQFYRLGV